MLRLVGSFVVAVCGILFPDQQWNPGPPALGARSLSPWTTREVLIAKFFKHRFFLKYLEIFFQGTVDLGDLSWRNSLILFNDI